jgi:hypothetical protein
MKNSITSLKAALLTSSLSLLFLGGAAVEAQAIQGQRLGGNAQAAGRQRHRIQVEFLLHARQHQIQEGPEGTQSVIVRENPDGPPSEGASFSTRVGLPDFSQREVNVLLPYEADADEVSLEIVDEQVESLGFFQLAPAVMPGGDVVEENGETFSFQKLPEGIQLDDQGRDQIAYSAQVSVPAIPLSISGVGGYRAYRYAKVVYSPFRWNPMTKELSKVVSVKGVLNCKPKTVITPSLRARELGDPGMKPDLALETVLITPGTIGSYLYSPRATEGDYLIVTTDLIRTASSQLAPFIAMKESQGHVVFVKTVEEIESAYPSTCRANSVRRFLRAEYQDLGIEYLLLIGDPDPDDQGDPVDSIGDVPMMMTWPSGAFVVDTGSSSSVSSHRCLIAPTDLYFTELTQADWDADNDGFPGELSDDILRVYYPAGTDMDYGFYVNQYGIDFDQEISGARIPFSEVSDVDDHLLAQIEYQTDAIDFVGALVRRRVTLAMAEFDSTTSLDSLGRQIAGELTSHVMGPFAPVEIYETPSYDILMEEDALADEWSGAWGSGLVIWAGHGSEYRTVVNEGTWSSTSYESFIRDTDAPGLTEVFTRAIVISISCLNARPSFRSNLTHDLMEHTAVGMFANTGVTYYLPSRSAAWGDESYGSDLSYDVSQSLVDGFAIGDSLRRARCGRSASSVGRAQSLIVITAYGDPSCGYRYE